MNVRAAVKMAVLIAVAGCILGCAEGRQAGSPSRTRIWDEEAFNEEILAASDKVGLGNLEVGFMKVGNMPLSVPDCVAALTRFGGRAEDGLRRHLEDPSTTAEVALALGVIGNDACIDDLIAAIGTSSPEPDRKTEIDASVVWALRNLTGQAVADSPRQWGKWLDQEDLKSKWEEWRKRGGTAIPRRKRARRRLPRGIILLNDPWTSVIAGEPGTPVKCRVLEVDDEAIRVLLSAGEDHGVKRGYRFIVYRGDEYVGKVEVEKVMSESCSARILRDRLREGESIKRGDKASTAVYY